MLQEEHKDLKDSKQRKIIDALLSRLSSQHPSFYYLSTTDIAYELHQLINKRTGIDTEDWLLVKNLSQHDIQILLSIHR